MSEWHQAQRKCGHAENPTLPLLFQQTEIAFPGILKSQRSCLHTPEMRGGGAAPPSDPVVTGPCPGGGEQVPQARNPEGWGQGTSQVRGQVPLRCTGQPPGHALCSSCSPSARGHSQHRDGNAGTREGHLRCGHPAARTPRWGEACPSGTARPLSTRGMRDAVLVLWGEGGSAQGLAGGGRGVALTPVLNPSLRTILNLKQELLAPWG